MLEQIDTYLSIIDIIICLIDIGLIVYLFFYRFPPEKKKQNNYRKFPVYRNQRKNKHSLGYK